MASGSATWLTQSAWTPQTPADPMAQLAVIILALFAQMERTYALERAAHAGAVATAKGRRVGGRLRSTPPSSTRPSTFATTATRWLR